MDNEKRESEKKDKGRKKNCQDPKICILVNAGVFEQWAQMGEHF